MEGEEAVVAAGAGILVGAAGILAAGVGILAAAETLVAAADFHKVKEAHRCQHLFQVLNNRHTLAKFRLRRTSAQITCL